MKPQEVEQSLCTKYFGELVKESLQRELHIVINTSWSQPDPQVKICENDSFSVLNGLQNNLKDSSPTSWNKTKHTWKWN